MNDEYIKMIDIMRKNMESAYDNTLEVLNVLEENIEIISLAVEWWITNMLDNNIDTLNESKILNFKKILSLTITKEIINNNECKLYTKNEPQAILRYACMISNIDLKGFSKFISMKIIRDNNELEIADMLNKERYHLNYNEFFTNENSKKYS